MNEKLYIIMLAQTEPTEERIITIKATNKDAAIHEYAKDYITKDENYQSFLESREVIWGYPQIFRNEVREFEESIKHRTDLTADDIEIMTIENIRKYLGDHQYYAERLHDFYTDTSQTVDDLDAELLNILATKFMYEELFAYIIKEVII